MIPEAVACMGYDSITGPEILPSTFCPIDSALKATSSLLVPS